MKKKTPVKELDLKNDIIPSADQGLTELWDAASEIGQKEIKNSLWVLTRWMSCINNGTREEKEHFLVTVNEYYNKNWNQISKHPKLQWQTLVTCNFNKMNYNHGYIPVKASIDKKAKVLSEIFPNMKMSDVKLLSSITDVNEIKEYLKDSGWDDKSINELKL